LSHHYDKTSRQRRSVYVISSILRCVDEWKITTAACGDRRFSLC